MTIPANDGQHAFDPKLATAEDAGDLAVLTVRAAIDFVGHQHRLAVLQPPYRPYVRESAVCFRHALGKNFLGPHRLSDLLRGGPPPAPQPPLSLASFLSTGSLSLFFRPQRERLRDLLRWRAAQLLLQFRDPPLRLVELLLRLVESLLGRPQLPLRHQDHFDQSIKRDLAPEDIFLELLNVHAPL